MEHFDASLVCFRALSDRKRLRLILLLTEEKELCACQIVAFLGIAGATVNRHLHVLKEADLISERREGRWVYISLNKKALPPEAWTWLLKIKEEAPECRQDVITIKEILCCDPSKLCRQQKEQSASKKENHHAFTD